MTDRAVSDNGALYQDCAMMLRSGMKKEAVKALSDGLLLSRSKALAIAIRITDFILSDEPIDTEELDQEVARLRD